MANKISVMNQLRPRIINQGTVDLEAISGRIGKNTTYNVQEIYSILRLCAEEINAALQEGQTVKIDRLISLTPNMKVGGAVNISVRPDRGAVANLNNPLLWTAAKVANYKNMTKTSDQLVQDWNAEHPDDPVEE
jgi:hypothetical protein